jgi:uncharacterized membrane protein
MFAAQSFAILAALTWAIGDSSARVALRTSTPVTGTLTLALVSLAVWGPVAWATFDRGEIQIRGLLIFVVSGMTLGLARNLLNTSFGRIGLARSTTIVSSSPLIAVLAAAVFLGEGPSSLIYLGTLSIMSGIILLAWERRSAARTWSSVRHDFRFAALSALTYGITAVLRKAGVSLIPSLSLGLSTAAFGTLLLIAVCYPFLPRTERVQFSRNNFGYFLVSAFFSTLSHFAFFAALQRGPLFTVAPLVYTAPLFVLVFSWLWFRQAEGLSFRLAVGVVLICAGAALVAMSRG